MPGWEGRGQHLEFRPVHGPFRRTGLKPVVCFSVRSEQEPREPGLTEIDILERLPYPA